MTKTRLAVFALSFGIVSTSATRALAEDAPHPTRETIRVTLNAAEEDGAELREIVGTSQMVASAGGRTAYGVATHYATLCVAPCTAAVQPGAKLVVTGDGFPTSSEFRAPRKEGAELLVKPGSTPGAVVGSISTVLGVTGVILGATLLGTSLILSSNTSESFRTIGLVSLGGGAALTATGIFVSYVSATRINDERGERVALAGFRGAF